MGFALAVVPAVEEPSSNCESGEAEYEDDEHDDPAPVGTHPGKGIELVCEWGGVCKLWLTRVLGWDL